MDRVFSGATGQRVSWIDQTNQDVGLKQAHEAQGQLFVAQLAPESSVRQSLHDERADYAKAAAGPGKAKASRRCCAPGEEGLSQGQANDFAVTRGNLKYS